MKPKTMIQSLHQNVRHIIQQPANLTLAGLEAMRMLKTMNRVAGEFVFAMDQVLDPATMNEVVTKLEMGLTYLKSVDATDRVTLINDMIKELKMLREVAQRMDETDAAVEAIAMQGE